MCIATSVTEAADNTDRDPRFVGGNPKADFPSPFVQFWQCLGVELVVCPPRRPDMNPFVERVNRTFSDECVHQGETCGNVPPRQAHPDLPLCPAVPAVMGPLAWLAQAAPQALPRRVQVRIDATTQEVVVQHEGREVKRQALKGLPPAQAQPFDSWATQVMDAAREVATVATTPQRVRQHRLRL
jgi:hypothetical protein